MRTAPRGPAPHGPDPSHGRPPGVAVPDAFEVPERHRANSRNSEKMNRTPLLLALALVAAPALADDAPKTLKGTPFTFELKSDPQPVINARLFTGADGTQRIDYAGKLRMLSQRAPAAACNKAAGVGGLLSRGYLAASILEMERVLVALEHGDMFLGIRAPEVDARVLRYLEDTKDLWQPARAEMDELVDAAEVGASALDRTAETAPTILKQVDKLVGEITSAYADPATLVIRDAIALDIVGRQRVTPQLMSKDVCMIAEGLSVEYATNELRDAVSMYDLSLTSLRNGMPMLGIAPPPNDATAAQLDEIIAAWKPLKPVLDKAVSGDRLSFMEREAVFNGMNDLTAMATDLSSAYARALK